MLGRLMVDFFDYVVIGKEEAAPCPARQASVRVLA
jgi:hypothetical protein